MPDFKGGIRTAAGGAGIGSVFGPVGAGIGAAVGFIAGLFGDSAEEQTERRKRALIEAINVSYARARENLGKVIGRRVAGLTQGASRRAASRGLNPNYAERAAVAASQQAYTQGQEQFEGLEEKRLQALAGAEADFAMQPLEPGLGETLLEAGATGAQIVLANRMIETLKSDQPKPSGGTQQLGPETDITGGREIPVEPASVGPPQQGQDMWGNVPIPQEPTRSVNPEAVRTLPGEQYGFNPAYGPKDPRMQGVYGASEARRRSYRPSAF